MTELITSPELSEEEIKDAVAYINRKVGEAQKNFLEVGKYVLDHFFDGSIEKAVSKNPYKNTSFKRLADHPHLLIDRTTLGRAVGLFIQQERILAAHREHAALLDQVSPTHQQMLLPVKKLDTKIMLLRRTVEDGLSTRALRKLVESEKKKVKSNRGRKPMPALQKTWRKCHRITVGNGDHFPRDRKRFIAKYNEAVTAETRESWLKEIEEVIGYLRTLHEVVTGLKEIPADEKADT